MQRPIISTYQDLVQFMADMIAFRKKMEPHFSILRLSKTLRRVSPALVTLILKRQRNITPDRADELAKLLGLTPHEKQYFKDWIVRTSGGLSQEEITPTKPDSAAHRRRKITSSHILADWINVYVKDAFQLKRIKNDPKEIYATLAGLAAQKRIDRALAFLLRAGYLRKNQDGKIVEETHLHSVDQRVPDKKVREFHKGALKTAIKAIDQYPPDHRYANALILPLDKKSYAELTRLIEEFAEQLQKFAENLEAGEGLYQILINLSPTGDFHD